MTPKQIPQTGNASFDLVTIDRLLAIAETLRHTIACGAQSRMETRQRKAASDSRWGMMLPPILKDGPLHLNRKAHWRVGGTATAVMDRLGVRDKDQPPTFGPIPFAPIHVFGIDKELFVEQTHLIHRFPSRKPKTTA
jgi:hypothetical protein